MSATDRFRALAEDVVDEALAADPVLATYLGDHRFDALLPDLSETALDARLRTIDVQVTALDAIDDVELDVADLVDLALVHDLHRDLDEFGELDWSAGLMGAPRIHYSRSFFRGIQLVRRRREVVYGLQTPAGRPVKAVDYKFDIDEVKQPVIAAIVSAGWTYQPILWPKR